MNVEIILALLSHGTIDVHPFDNEIMELNGPKSTVSMFYLHYILFDYRLKEVLT